MVELAANLIRLYVPLIVIGGLGLLLGYKLPPEIPQRLGKFLFWVGVPLGIFAFLRQSDLSESLWIAPIVAWMAMLLGIGLAWGWMRLAGWRVSPQQIKEMSGERSAMEAAVSVLQPTPEPLAKPAQGSFMLASMVGNTGYLGFPVSLALVGPSYFGWAIFYDTLGSTLGAYGLGVLIAARFGDGRFNRRQLLHALVINPALWSFGLGLLSHNIPFPAPIETGLKGAGWCVVTIALLLIGMRLSKLRSWRRLSPAVVGLSIKMAIVPLVLGTGLSILGLPEPIHLVLVLQMAMPPAFATLVLAEAYDLDRELTVTALAMGSIGLLVTLPVWLVLFAR